MAELSRDPGTYSLKSEPDEQVTPMGDSGWYVVHHTSIPNDYWWAVRHQCPDGMVYGMAFRPGQPTYCNGCKISLPKEIEGFIHLIEWRR